MTIQEETGEETGEDTCSELQGKTTKTSNASLRVLTVLQGEGPEDARASLRAGM